jgi:two-component system sensor histidine kinase KdpD
MNKLLQNQVIKIVAGHLAAVMSIVLTTVLLRSFHPFLEIQIIVLIFLLPVILSTVLWGLTPGILAGVLAFLAFNYYFLEPYYTLQVHASQDLITLIIFLIVAIVMSQLIGQAKEAVRLARSREWEATCMYELISAFASLQDTQSIALALADHLLDTFHFTHVEVLIGSGRDNVGMAVSPQNHSRPGTAPTRQIPLKTARGQEGELHLWIPEDTLSAEEERLLDMSASQGALSLERIRLTKSENKARILEESDQLKSSLLNSVSHELRTPLSAIKASVSFLRGGTLEWNSDACQELLTTIEEETDQLNQLVGNLLDMSRIESGALKPQQRWNSIEEIAMSVIAKMRKQTQNHRLTVDISDNLPLVPTDYVQISQVFTNLISNSVKYAPAGTEIRLRAVIENERMHVSVANQGPQVPEESLTRIFDKFYRITEAERVTGTGLGLSICKGIIEAHGGDIWAENQPGWFIFNFTLPLTLNGLLPDNPKEAGNE